MDLAADMATLLLVLAAAFCIGRLLRPGSLADRIVALDALLVVIVSGIIIHATARGAAAFLDVAVVAALLGFVGTITVARFIERRGA